MSDPDCRHSQAILKNEKVAGSITVSNRSKELNFGIQFEGIAKKIDGPRHDLALRHFAKRGNPALLENDDILGGDSWYALELSKIRLIDEKHFGYETQDVDIGV